ncbi:MAG: tetratricopeptide repeat protein, partial [Planctomycetota bacterium]
EPGRRYASARAFAEDLRSWQKGKPITARRPSLFERMLFAVRRRPQRAAAVAVFVVLVAVIGFLFLRGRKTAPRRPGVLPPATEVIFNEALRIEKWETNLYKPARQISYAELEDAVRKLRKVVDHPKLQRGARHRGLFAMARAHIFMGRTDEAMDELDEAIKVGRGDRIGEYHFERARILWEGLLREALSKNKAAAERLLARVEKDLKSGLKAGFADDWYRDFARALLKLVKQRSTGVQEALEELGRLQKTAEMPTEEVTKFVGDLHLLSDRPDEAIRYFEGAIGIRQCYVQAYNGLALAYLQKGKTENIGHALRYASTAIDMNPRYEDSYFLFALLCRSTLRASPRDLGKWEETEQEFIRQALGRLRMGSQVRPDSQPILLARGTACVLWAFMRVGAKQDPEEALKEAKEALEKAIGLDEGAFEPCLALGMAHTLRALWRKEKGKDVERARECLERARDLAPESPDVHRWMGYHCFITQDFEGAASAWRRALELNPALKGELEGPLKQLESRK